MSIFLPATDEQASRRRRGMLQILLVAAVLCAVAARPAFQACRTLYARKLVAEAEAYFAQNRSVDALARGRAALAAGASGTRILELMVRVLAPQNPTEAFRYWSALANHPEVTSRQRAELMKQAVAWGQLHLAESQWKVLRKESPLSTATLRAGAAFFEARGDAASAARCAQALLEANTGDLEARLLLGRVLLRGGGPRDISIGKRLLFEQAGRLDAAGLHALRFLAGSGMLSPFEAADCRGRMERHPLRSASDLLLEATLEAQITPYQKSEIITRAGSEFLRQGGSAAELAGWFSAQNAPEELITLISAGEAVRDAQTLPHYIDALGALKQWQRIEELLAHPDAAVEPLWKSLFLARVAAQQEAGRIAELRWEQALEIAGNEPRALVQLAEFARRAAAGTIAERACERLIQLGGEPARRGYQQLIRIYADDLPAAAPILERFAAAFPESSNAENDFLYATLLLGKAGPEHTARAERLAESEPEYMSFRTTLALALLREGEPRRARIVLQQADQDWPRMLPYQQLVFAAVAAAAGELELAREVSGQLDLAALRPEEKRLLEGSLNAPAPLTASIAAH